MESKSWKGRGSHHQRGQCCQSRRTSFSTLRRGRNREYKRDTQERGGMTGPKRRGLKADTRPKESSPILPAQDRVLSSTCHAHRWTPTNKPQADLLPPARKLLARPSNRYFYDYSLMSMVRGLDQVSRCSLNPG